MVAFDIIIGKLIHEEGKETTAPVRPIGTDPKRSFTSGVCKDCKNGKNKKVLLKCGDTICKDCMTVYLLTEFSEGRSYEHRVYCKRTNKKEIIGILLSNN